MSTYHIVFPRGEKDKLAVIELSEHSHYELNEYCVASRHEFTDELKCIDYARKLAKEHSLTYEGNSDGYLD